MNYLTWRYWDTTRFERVCFPADWCTAVDVSTVFSDVSELSAEDLKALQRDDVFEFDIKKHEIYKFLSYQSLDVL